MRADPARAPEHPALAAAEKHAPAAAAWVAERRAMYAVTPHELAVMAKRRHAGLARYGGAATGIGGIVTAVPDLLIAAWIQSRLIFFVAASFGFDPFDPMRPAEQLVLQGMYPTPSDARRALDGAGRHVALAAASKARTDDAITRRLAHMVGRRAVRRAGAHLIPGFGAIYNAIGNERDTRALADRAIAFYGG